MARKNTVAKRVSPLSSNLPVYKSRNHAARRTQKSKVSLRKRSEQMEKATLVDAEKEVNVEESGRSVMPNSRINSEQSTSTNFLMNTALLKDISKDIIPVANDVEKKKVKKTRKTVSKNRGEVGEDFDETDAVWLKNQQTQKLITKGKNSSGKKRTAEKTHQQQFVSEIVKKKQTKRFAFGISKEQKSSAVKIGAKVLAAAKKSNKMIGMHTSAAGSLEQSVYNAYAVGCKSFAFFVRNQRTWECPPLMADVVNRFKEALKVYSYSLDLIMPHGSYLINAGSSDPKKLQKSRAAMLDECERCEELGLKLYNFHPGSTAGLCTRESCINTIAETINYVIEKTKFLTLVLETMAGQGNTIGGNFEELRKIIDLVEDESRVGVCIDTCHIFAAGYDIRTKRVYEDTMRKFDEVIGFKFLKGLHINDSKGDLGSRIDRHMNIGRGKITMSGFVNFINDPRFDGLPMILETPAGSEHEEMIRLYKTVVQN